jgi:hypothetical protein
MKAKRYIFLSFEGFTFQPGSEATEPDIENLQVIGMARGTCPDNAFIALLKENPYLASTSFEELICLELAEDSEKTKKYFYLSDRSN